MFNTGNSVIPNLIQTAFFWLWGITLAILVISMIIDRRRFRNCFYLLFHLGALGILLVISTWGTSFGVLLLLFFVLFSIFLFLILPFLLIVNGFIMIWHEGFRIANLLSFAFGVMVFIGEYALFDALIPFESSLSHFAILAFGILILYTCIIFLAFLLYSVLSSWIPKETTFDYVIVHGCGLIHGREVSHLLAARIQKGMKVYRRSMSDCKLICSGGKGPDEEISEADAMKEYMISHGIPESDILMEDGSFTTIQNLKNSKEMIEHRGGRTKIALVTSNYHVLRALIYTAKLNLDCTGFGSHVAMYYWPSAMIREFIALMKEYLLWYVSGAILCELPLMILFLGSR
ncbi:MAG: YdcF family protein [Erysipelotrichia bacterium]|nr:YdcF family protein [Erysipelotrichia bacterium]